MTVKYSKFCSKDQLIEYLMDTQKSQFAQHIFKTLWKKPLQWLNNMYDHETLYDAIDLMRGICVKQLNQNDIVWVFIVEGSILYHGIRYQEGESFRFNDFNIDYVKMQSFSTLAVLLSSDLVVLKDRYEIRQKQKIIRQVKQSIFDPFFLKEPYIREFVSLANIVRLRKNMALEWNENVNKIGMIFKGSIAVEFDWKRKVTVCVITEGMYFVNNRLRPETQQLQCQQAIPQQTDQSHLPSYPKFRYVSNDDETVLLLFKEETISDTPFNINKELKSKIISQSEHYEKNLQKIIKNKQYNRIHRNKKSLKEEIRKLREHNIVKKNIHLNIEANTFKSTPILRSYTSYIESSIDHQPDSFQLFVTGRKQRKQSSKNPMFSTIGSDFGNKKTIQRTLNSSLSQRVKKVPIHNTWVEHQISKTEITKNKLKKNNKSFSTLTHLTTHRQQDSILIAQENKKQKQENQQSKFFAPKQFVSRKLKLQYQILLNKIDKLETTPRVTSELKEETLKNKMKRLEGLVDTQRIVRIKNTKKKFKNIMKY